MVLVVRTEPRRLRSAFSFSVSGMGHASILAWVALGSILPKTASPNLYEQEIQPNVHKIIWYNLRERLPDIAPSEKPRDPRPPRARVKSQQNLAAGTIDTSQPPQLIWSPAPVIEVRQMLPSVNVIALAP